MNEVSHMLHDQDISHIIMLTAISVGWVGEVKHSFLR